MKIKQIIESLDFSIPVEEVEELNNTAKGISKMIRHELKKFNGECFIGGSFAKGTLMKRRGYDIDIFVRLKQINDDTYKILDNVLMRISNSMNLEIKKIHGSRDYYSMKNGDFVFEIIPVKKINHPVKSENSTDLSYFHVKYVKNKINESIKKGILLAKAFCRAQGVYGAESWVHGFSGYALECLVIYYGSFEKMLKVLSKANEQIVIDLEKQYRNKNEIIIEMNESKRKSPIILVDPTYKQRNVCSALEWSTFKKFQESAKKFLRRPSKSFFEAEEVNENKLKNKGKENYIKIKIKTNKQEGDIAGAKLEKFYRCIIEEIGKRYSIKEKIFIFDERQEADIHIIAIPNKKAVQIGPPLKMKKECEIFKKAHKNAFVRAGRLYTPIEIKPIHTFLNEWKNKNMDKIKSMDISKIII